MDKSADKVNRTDRSRFIRTIGGRLLAAFQDHKNVPVTCSF